MLLNIHFQKYGYHFENYIYIIVKRDWICLSSLFVLCSISYQRWARTNWVFTILFIVIFFVAYKPVLWIPLKRVCNRVVIPTTSTAGHLKNKGSTIFQTILSPQ